MVGLTCQQRMLIPSLHKEVHVSSAPVLFWGFFNTNAITTFHDRHSSETNPFAMDTYNERLVRKKNNSHIRKHFCDLFGT